MVENGDRLPEMIDYTKADPHLDRRQDVENRLWYARKALNEDIKALALRPEEMRGRVIRCVDDDTDDDEILIVTEDNHYCVWKLESAFGSSDAYISRESYVDWQTLHKHGVLSDSQVRWVATLSSELDEIDKQRQREQRVRAVMKEIKETPGLWQKITDELKREQADE